MLPPWIFAPMPVSTGLWAAGPKLQRSRLNGGQAGIGVGTSESQRSGTEFGNAAVDRIAAAVLQGHADPHRVAVGIELCAAFLDVDTPWPEPVVIQAELPAL